MDPNPCPQERGWGTGAGPCCLLTLGTARLPGSSYLQSRELPLTPSWALTLYDPVKEPSWAHGHLECWSQAFRGCRPPGM